MNSQENSLKHKTWENVPSFFLENPNFSFEKCVFSNSTVLMQYSVAKLVQFGDKILE